MTESTVSNASHAPPTPGGDPAVVGVDNVLIKVGDLDAAVAHFRDGLGLPLKFRLDARGIALFALGDGTPGLLAQVTRVAAPPAPGGMRVWVEVPDARAAVESLRRRAVTGVGEPFATATGGTVEVTDPWRNVVGLADYTLRPEMGRRHAAARP